MTRSPSGHAVPWGPEATSVYGHFRQRVESAPDATAILFGDRRLSYADLATEIDRVARGLHALGIARGERVLMFAGNTPAVLTTYLAVTRLGAIFTPVNSSFREREGRYILETARPEVSIVEAPLLDEFAGWGAAADHRVVVLEHEGTDHTLPEGASAFGELGRDDPDAPVVTVADDEGALLCFTSGTTSTPKAVLHSHRSEVYNARTYAEVWGLGPEDRGIVALPLTWVYGLSTTSMALLTSGGAVVLLDRFHPVRVIEAIAAERATALWGTMSMYLKLLEVLEQRTGDDLSSLRVVNNGGEPCPPAAVRRFEQRTGLQLLGSYATSEVRPLLVVRPGSDDVPEGSSGQLVPGAEIVLEGADGTPVSDGESGHALIRCPGRLTEYYGAPELTAERLTADGWFRTGDILKRDAAGHYFVVGRQGDMIIRSGVNVAPAEIESALVGNPDVVDAAVVGLPDPRSGESICAFVVSRPGSTPSEDSIRHAVAAELASYKVPQAVVFVDDLPRTVTGKLDRNALRVSRTDAQLQGT